jgi:hypothetical protein
MKGIRTLLGFLPGDIKMAIWQIHFPSLNRISTLSSFQTNILDMAMPVEPALPLTLISKALNDSHFDELGLPLKELEYVTLTTEFYDKQKIGSM